MRTVSVILTTFNSSSTLQRTLDSLFRQTGLNTDFHLEIIIVDDCSTDNTHQIIKDNNLEYYTTQVNSGGPNKGRNIGLGKVSGDYICIMDHDDEWLPGKIISQLAISEKAPIISTGYYEKDEITGIVREYVNPSYNSSGSNFYDVNRTFLDYLARSRKGQKAYIGGLMFHKSRKNILFEEKYAMVDFDWFLRLFHGQTSAEVCQPLFIRHLSGANLSFNETYRLNDYAFSLETIEKYRDEYPLQVKLSAEKINGTMARYYYKMENMKMARKYIRKTGLSPKNIAYYLTSFYGYKFVNKRFKVF